MVTGTLPIWDTKIVKIVFINNKNEKKHLYHTATTKQIMSYELDILMPLIGNSSVRSFSSADF